MSLQLILPDNKKFIYPYKLKKKINPYTLYMDACSLEFSDKIFKPPQYIKYIKHWIIRVIIKNNMIANGEFLLYKSSNNGDIGWSKFYGDLFIKILVINNSIKIYSEDKLIYQFKYN